MEDDVQYNYRSTEAERKVLSKYELLELLGISELTLRDLKKRDYLKNRLLLFGWKLTKEEGLGKKSKYTLEKVNIKQLTENELNGLTEEGSYSINSYMSEIDKCRTHILKTILANQDNVEKNFTYMSADLFKVLGINYLPASDEMKMRCVEKVFIIVKTKDKRSFRIAGKRTEGYSKVALPN